MCTWVIEGWEVGSGIIETEVFSYIWISSESKGR